MNIWTSRVFWILTVLASVILSIFMLDPLFVGRGFRNHPNRLATDYATSASALASTPVADFARTTLIPIGGSSTRGFLNTLTF